jgi:hypothetical protein
MLETEQALFGKTLGIERALFCCLQITGGGRIIPHPNQHSILATGQNLFLVRR